MGYGYLVLRKTVSSVPHSIQKQVPISVLIKRCSENMQLMHVHQHGCSPVNLLRIFGISFPKNTYGGLLLPISKMNNGMAAGPSGLVQEMAAGEAGVDIITNLINRIKVEGVIPVEWQLSTTVDCYMGKEDTLERGNCRGLKLRDQILKIIE